MRTNFEVDIDRKEINGSTGGLLEKAKGAAAIAIMGIASTVGMKAMQSLPGNDSPNVAQTAPNLPETAATPEQYGEVLSTAGKIVEAAKELDNNPRTISTHPTRITEYKVDKFSKKNAKGAVNNYSLHLTQIDYGRGYPTTMVFEQVDANGKVINNGFKVELEVNYQKIEMKFYDRKNPANQYYRNVPNTISYIRTDHINWEPGSKEPYSPLEALIGKKVYFGKDAAELNTQLSQILSGLNTLVQAKRAHDAQVNRNLKSSF